MIKRKTAAWIGAVTTAAAAITVWCISTAADRRFDELTTRAEALQSRLDAAHVRPILFGTATPGNAWDAYALAIELAKADAELEGQVRPVARKKLDPTQLTRFLSTHADILAHVRRGAHCETVREPIDWTRGFGSVAHSLLDLRGIGNLVVTQALAQIEQGEPAAAVETLLDGAQLGRDLMHSHLLINEMIGNANLTISTIEAVRMNDLLERLPPAALERFARGLATLDEHIERVGPSLHGEAVLFAATARVHPELFAGMGISPGSWRHGFSTRLMFADISLRMIDHADRAVAAARGPWPACDTYLSSLEKEMSESGDPALIAAAMARSFFISRFQTIARLRLLRMAIAHRLSRPVPELIDPFGGTLRHEVDTEGKARFWSTGTAETGRLFLFPRRS